MNISEKYRPVKLDELVLPNETFKNKIQEWISKGSIDGHILLYGLPGLGKSSTINVLLNELQITDYTRINVSNQTSIDDMRKIIDYASVPPLEGHKIIILEEFERASKQAQDSLKFVLDTYAGWCNFIFTTNNINNVNDAIVSRTQQYQFNSLPYEAFVTRIAQVLQAENISVSSTNTVVSYIDTYYPDLRACLTAINQNTINNVLQELASDTTYSIEKFDDIINSLNTKSILDTKKLIGSTMTEELYEPFYQYLYNNLDKLSSDMKHWDMLLIKIAEYLYKHESCAFSCINLMACLIELNLIKKS